MTEFNWPPLEHHSCGEHMPRYKWVLEGETPVLAYVLNAAESGPPGISAVKQRMVTPERTYAKEELIELTDDLPRGLPVFVAYAAEIGTTILLDSLNFLQTYTFETTNKTMGIRVLNLAPTDDPRKLRFVWFKYFLLRNTNGVLEYVPNGESEDVTMHGIYF